MRADTYTEFHQDLWKAVAENLSEEERGRCFAQADAAQMAIFSYAASLGSHYFKDLEHKAAIGFLRRYVWTQVGLWGIILGVGLFLDRGLGAPHNSLALLALFVFQLFCLGDFKAQERWLRYECFKLQIKLRDERLQCAAKLPRVDPPYIQAVIEPYCAMFLVQGELQGITEEFQEFGRDRDKFLDTWHVLEKYPKQMRSQILNQLHIKNILRQKLLCHFAGPVALQHGLEKIAPDHQGYGRDFYEPLSWDYAEFAAVTTY